MVSRRVLLQARRRPRMGWKPAFSASWPARSVRLVSPTSVGTTTDTVARFVADGLSKRLKAAFMVEPRPGAGGIIASSEVARSRADGYTVLFGAIGHYLAQYLTDNPRSMTLSRISRPSPGSALPLWPSWSEAIRRTRRWPT